MFGSKEKKKQRKFNSKDIPSPEETVNFFNLQVGQILTQEIFKNKSFNDIEIHVTTYIYLQLLVFWGSEMHQLMSIDPVYSRITINTTQNEPVKIYYYPESKEKKK